MKFVFIFKLRKVEEVVRNFRVYVLKLDVVFDDVLFKMKN